MKRHIISSQTDQKGFSLVEVVLAIGIFLVTVLALVGLLGPTLKSVDEVEKTDEVSSIVNTLNAFLQSSPDIAPAGSKFDAIYSAVADGGEATVFIFRYFDDNASVDGEAPVVRNAVGFNSGEGVDARAEIDQTLFQDSAGPIYRAVLSASSVTPDAWRADRNGNGIHTLTEPSPAIYPEGYFAMEVRIFAEDGVGPGVTFDNTTDLGELNDVDPIFTYNTAVVR
jgi:type II secretory pathway pseudopilin PulG